MLVLRKYHNFIFLTYLIMSLALHNVTQCSTQAAEHQTKEQDSWFTWSRYSLVSHVTVSVHTCLCGSQLCPIPIIITSHSHSVYHFHHVPFPFSMSHSQSGPKVLSSHDQSEWRLGRRVCRVSRLPDQQPPEWPRKETSIHGSCKLGVLDHAKI